MKTKIIKVSTPNKMLFIKGKLSRTPLEAIINSENDLNLLKSSMIHQGLEFKIEDYIPIKVRPKIKNIVSKKKIIKKKNTEPKTMLEKISAEESNE